MNLVSCDLSMNKVMHHDLRDLDAQLAINRKFKNDVKNIEIEREKKQMKFAGTELQRNQQEQKR